MGIIRQTQSRNPFRPIDKNDVIQIQMNNQGFNAEQIKWIYIYIYIQRVKPFEDQI